MNLPDPSLSADATHTHGATRLRAIQIVRFLREYARMRSVVKRDVRDYADHLWFHDVPHESGCYVKGRVVDDEQADVWLQVKKQPEPRLPAPPESVRAWADPETLRDSANEPRLRAEILVRREAPAGQTEPLPPETLRLDDCPSVMQQWQRWVGNVWRPWSDLHQRWKRVHDVYSKLFSIHQELVKRGEELELLVGVGLLVWRTPKQQIIRRHLLTARAVLSFDASAGLFTVTAPSDGARVLLELDMLDAEQSPTLDEKRQIENLLARTDNDLWDRSTIEPALAALAHSISKDGEFQSEGGDHTHESDTARVLSAPALVLRTRSSRGYLALLNSVLTQLENGAAIPGGMALVSGADPVARVTQNESREPEHTERIHFPLPANHEQLQIVKRLRGSPGVLVQGPPGTGKSHTIANLICHLLATGKRVLITAQTPRALKVLHEKIPPAIRPLCVSLLGNDKSSFDRLEHCVQEIVSRYQTYDEGAYKTRIAESRTLLESLAQGESRVLDRLKLLRERETLQHSVASGEYQGTAASIANRLALEQSLQGWIEDDISSGAHAPLRNSEAVRLLQLLREVEAASPEDRSKTALDPHEARALVNAIGPLSRAEAIAQVKAETTASGADASLARAVTCLSHDDVASLVKEFTAFATLLRQTLSRRQRWIANAVRDVLSGNLAAWRTLRESAPRDPRELLAIAKRRDSVRIAMPQELDPVRVAADAEDLHAYLSAGGSLGLLSSFRTIVKRTNYLRQGVTVDGRAPDSLPVLATLIECLGTERTLDDAWRFWSQHAARPRTSLVAQTSDLVEHLESLDAVLSLAVAHEGCQQELAKCPGITAPVWHDPESVRALLVSVENGHSQRIYIEARGEIENRLDSLRLISAKPESHPVCSQLLAALSARNAEGAAALLHRIEALDRLAAKSTEATDLLRRLRSAAPLLAQTLTSTLSDGSWDLRLNSLENAWAHTRARSWIEETFGDADEQSCDAELQRINQRQGEAVGHLAADLAWVSCMSRMTEEQRQHFVAWSQAMKSLGKGTGKYANKYRQDAQRSLSKCRDAIPAWIMPLHQVYESVEPAPGVFDVIIVDEASQCGIDSRILTFMGSQLVVVGDDQQISPEAVGLERSEAFQLIQEILVDVPHAPSFQPDRSLFDFAELWYGERIVLQEHFRCVPEIIRFSSDLCYKTKPLIPLRQYPPDRLRPVVPVRISGMRFGTGSSTQNRQEAEAVVDAISRCCADERYAGMSFGVISLQGGGQAKLIEKLLNDALDPKEIEARRIMCGDAYSFQGDERNVMFLSMVSAPNETIGALTKATDVRRFNVAVSRAQDQMWLFHSVDAGDLNVECCRRKLLAYCYEPRVQTFRGLPVDAWREKAAGLTRQIGHQPAPFESWFELDVFLSLVARGYRVIPQYEVASARIDLMVEGLRSRLAVECNGEYWHGPDRWEQDQVRQRRLERAGLHFFTVWESAFRRNADESLEPLWHALERLRIQPLGTGESLTLDVDGYVPSDARPDEPTVDASSEAKSVVLSAGIDQVPAEQAQPGRAPLQPIERIAVAESTGESTRGRVPAASHNTNALQSEDLFPALEAPSHILGRVETYTVWNRRTLADPRVAEMRDLVEGLKDIISVEGPILCLLAYQRFSRAAGVMKLHGATRARFNQAVQRGVKAGVFELADGYGAQFQMNRFVRLKGQPPVRLRTLGPRTIHEVPPDEVAAMMHFFATKLRFASRDQLFRAVLDAYGLVRATEQTIGTLEEARKRGGIEIDG